MITKQIAPAPGRRVRRPDQGFKLLPETGATVEWSTHWERLLADGDIVVIEPDKAEKKKATDAGGDK